MPSKLAGENDSIGGILALLLLGIITCITTVQLLLPPGMTMQAFQAWISPTEDPEHSAPALISDPSTIEVPVTAEITLPPIPSQTIAPELPALGRTVDAGRVAPQRAAEPPMPAKAAVADRSSAPIPEAARDKPGQPGLHQSGRRSTQQVPGQRDKTSAPVAEFAASEAVVSTDRAGFEAGVDRHDSQDCAPLFSVGFVHDGIQPLDSDLFDKARRLRDWFERHPQAELLVEGRADASGPEEYNLFISHRRAKAVYNLLARVGIPEARMSIRALGEYAPLEGLSPQSAKNRRVSLRIEGVRACSNPLNNGNNR
jgi:outer membrane protein OmpA-like peptidoglycan-associated protein